MSRAMRRHPVRSGGGRGRQPPARAAVPRPTPPRRPSQEGRDGRGSSGAFRLKWAGDIINELRKVTWPSWQETRYLTFVVLIVATAIGLFLGGVDLLFNWFIDNTLLS